jgi:hypothetical protein
VSESKREEEKLIRSAERGRRKTKQFHARPSHIFTSRDAKTGPDFWRFFFHFCFLENPVTEVANNSQFTRIDATYKVFSATVKLFLLKIGFLGFK